MYGNYKFRQYAATTILSSILSIIVMIVDTYNCKYLSVTLLVPVKEYEEAKNLQVIYNLLGTARYLVWRPWAIIFPVFFFFNSTLTTPTALPTRRTLASISISSWKNRNRKLQMNNKSQFVVLKLFYKYRGTSWHAYTNPLTRQLLWWMKLTPRINVDTEIYFTPSYRAKNLRFAYSFCSLACPTYQSFLFINKQCKPSILSHLINKALLKRG